ncbi:hypothetical protein [Inediibacterium massiliense]|uniref:hypothetical protein n=1 Tax=Inediibacterium massiliense TaxID=1658111 RepID=UPI0006B654D9|nr:hypothetical protein [Inediibacterium massiliense]
MNIPCTSQYICYDLSGFTYYFYMEEDHLYLKIFKDHTLYETSKISENIIDYCVTMDSFGVFHLVSISSYGDLKYCIYQDHKWEYRYLTKYDSKSFLFKNLKLFIVDDHIHILMAISNIIHPELWILKHHYWNGSSWSNRKVCDMVTEKYDVPFCCDTDPDGHIHIVFKSSYEKQYQLYYCKYHIVYDSWSIPIKISSSDYDHSHPFILCDSAGSTHIIWSSFYDNNLTIFYMYQEKSNHQKNDWSQPICLSNINTNSTHPILIQIDDQIYMIWKESNKYFVTSRNIYEKLWSPLDEINIENDHKPFCISVLGNQYKSLEKVKILNSYGLFFENEFFLIGVDHHLPSFSPQEDISCDTKDLEADLVNDTNNVFSQENHLLKLTEEIENIKTMQQEIKKNFYTLYQQQISQSKKTDELLQLHSNLYALLENNQNHFLNKLKNLFK